jgi:hypothetical protein
MILYEGMKQARKLTDKRQNEITRNRRNERIISCFDRLSLKLQNSHNYRTLRCVIKLECGRQLCMVQCHEIMVLQESFAPYSSAKLVSYSSPRNGKNAEYHQDGGWRNRGGGGVGVVVKLIVESFCTLDVFNDLPWIHASTLRASCPHGGGSGKRQVGAGNTCTYTHTHTHTHTQCVRCFM